MISAFQTGLMFGHFFSCLEQLCQVVYVFLSTPYLMKFVKQHNTGELVFYTAAEGVIAASES